MSDIENDDEFLDFEDDDLLEEEDSGAFDALDDDVLDVDLDAELDEEWDEFDDDQDDNGAAVGVAPEAGDKSFVSRYFNVIVIVVAVVIGGWIFSAKFLGGGSKQAPPPVPEQTAAQHPAFAADHTDNTGQAGHKGKEHDNKIDLDLNHLRRSDTRVPVQLPYEDDIKALDAEQESVTDGEELNIADYAGQDLAPEDDIFSQAYNPETSDTKTAPMPENQTGETLTPMPDLSAQTQETASVSPEPVVSQDKQHADALEQETVRLHGELETLSHDNVALEKALAEEKIVTHNLEKTIADLKANIVQLENRMVEAENKAMAVSAAKPIQTKKEKAAYITPQKSVNVPVTSKAASSSKPSSQTPVKAVSKPAPLWVLQSAHDGKAVLKDRNTGNILRVHVGQNVDGLGTIRSIGLQNGTWIVQGSRHSVKR